MVLNAKFIELDECERFTGINLACQFFLKTNENVVFDQFCTIFFELGDRAKLLFTRQIVPNIMVLCNMAAEAAEKFVFLHGEQVFPRIFSQKNGFCQI